MVNKEKIETIIKIEGILGSVILSLFFIIIIYEKTTDTELLDLNDIIPLTALVVLLFVVQFLVIPKIYPTDFKEYLKHQKNIWSKEDMKQYKRVVRIFFGVGLFLLALNLLFILYGDFDIMLTAGIFCLFILASLGRYYVNTIEKIK